LRILQRTEKTQNVLGGPGGTQDEGKLVQNGKGIDALDAFPQEGGEQGKAHVGNLGKDAAHDLAGALVFFVASALNPGCQNLLAVRESSAFAQAGRCGHFQSSSFYIS
jgi:hypothetical protein